MNLRLPAIFLAALAISGCASYVNIPPDSNEDVAINAINVIPTPRLVGTALDYVITAHPAPQTPYAVRLPVEASALTWSKVLENREGAVAYSPSQPDLPVYDVRSIRIRGGDAWVDVVVPQTRDNRPLVEVRLEGYLSGWRVASVRHWSESVIRQRESSGQYLPGPAAAPPEEPAPGADEPALETPSGSSGDSTGAPSTEDQRPLTPLRPVKPGGGD
jgi:hypothetical protein